MSQQIKPLLPECDY